jgi:formyl-CoA transferase
VRQLSDWGANIIKVEMREGPGNEGGADFSARTDPDFQNLQRGKRSIALNLKTPEGLEILYRMAAKADVVVENFRPDVKTRLKIDYDTLSKINPRIIYASISGFGQDGPYVNRPGVDQIAQGMSGLMSFTGEPGRGPMRVGIAVADLSAGLFAALGILTALYERETSGKGQWVQTSLLQAMMFMLDFQAARYAMKGEVPQQVGNNHPTTTPTGTFKTKDGYINIAPVPPMWERFCKAIRREDLFKHPDYDAPKKRYAHRPALNVEIEKMTVTKTTDELIESLNKAGIPCGPIYSVDQAFVDPQVQHLHVTQTVHEPELGDIPIMAQPFTLSRTPSKLTTAAPGYGEHTEELLSEFGYSKDQIEKLRTAGIA